MKARAILRELIAEIRNPDIANGPAAMRAVLAAEALFLEEEDDLQKRSPEAEVSPARGSGENAPGHPESVRGGNPKRKAPGKGHSTIPGGEAQK